MERIFRYIKVYIKMKGHSGKDGLKTCRYKQRDEAYHMLKQRVHLTFNQRVEGSSPSWLTSIKNLMRLWRGDPCESRRPHHVNLSTRVKKVFELLMDTCYIINLSAGSLV